MNLSSDSLRKQIVRLFKISREELMAIKKLRGQEYTVHILIEMFP